VDVVNPYAAQLTFTAKHTRTRRDHEKYLTLIDAIALLHQHQRPRESEEGGDYITVTLQDIQLANRIAPELLGRSLDELPPQTRRLLDAVKELVKERCEAEDLEPRTAFFSRRQIRDRLGWGVTQVRAHLERLRDLEYVAARFGRPGSTYQYELLVDPFGEPGADPVGLLDPEKLRVRSEPVGVNGNPSGGCRPKARQVQTPVKPGLKPLSKDNLTACSDRTSGTRSENRRTVGVGG